MYLCRKYVYNEGVVQLTRLKQWRERRALTQLELADAAGLSRATIAALEAGKNRPYPKTVRSLAKVLRVDVGDLMEPMEMRDG